MMGGWSPGRLSLAGRTPELFDALPPGVPGLSAAETAEAFEAPRLTAALGDFTVEGISLSCVRGIGIIEGWDLHPGGWPQPDDSPEEIRRSSLYRHDAVAYCCAFAGLRLTDARPFTGPPDAWAALPPGDYWAVTD